jgi:hypothetical protein
MPSSLRFVCFAVTITILTVGRAALADKIAVLPFTSAGSATSADLDHARAATRGAVQAIGRTLPSDSEMVTAQMAYSGEHGEPSKAYQAAGRASGADWVTIGHVDPHGATYRVELEVCQTDTGRLESLAREIDRPNEVKEIGEMLALLARPEGISNADIPWLTAAPPKPASPPAPTASTTVETKPPPTPPPPPPPPGPRHAYAEGHPLAIGAGLDVYSAVHRASNAVGSAASLQIDGVVGYAIDSVPGLELRGRGMGSAAGPSSFAADVGARYAFPVLPRARVFAGPEVGAGAFFTLGADKTTRFLAHGALVGSVGIGARVQVEVAGDLDYAPGGSAALVFVGGTARAVVRF